jgi:hypothetical protein
MCSVDPTTRDYDGQVVVVLRGETRSNPASIQNNLSPPSKTAASSC